MKYAILSDIHSNIHALKAAIKSCRANKVDKIICLGDVVGYNAKPSQCIKIAKKEFDIAIKGNHDDLALSWLSSSEIRYWSPDAVAGIRHTADQIDNGDRKWLASLENFKTIGDKYIPFTLGHGIPFPQKSYEQFDYILDFEVAVDFIDALKKSSTGVNLGFFGHTHTPTIARGYNYDEDSRLSDWDRGSYLLEEDYGLGEIDLKYVVSGEEFMLINPGSIGQPRGHCKPSYVILDTKVQELSFVTFDYNFKLAQKAIKDANYCDRLAERLDYTVKPSDLL